MISNGIIANIQVDFSITKNSTYSNNEVLLEAFNILKGIFFYRNIKFGDSFVISDIMSTLQASPKILSVGSLNITNITGSIGGSVYSNSVVDMRQNNGVITLPQNVVWEVKYPNKDIIGTVV